MNVISIVLLLLVVLGTPLHPLAEHDRDEDTRVEQIIQSFMDSQGMDIKPWTDEYKVFMGGIVLSEYPELTGEDSGAFE